MQSVECNCDGWKSSFQDIATAQTIADNHGFKYTGLVFKYCPWCGTELANWELVWELVQEWADKDNG